MHGIAFAELVVFMEDMLADVDNLPVFRPSDMANLYKSRLEQHGSTMSNIIHTIRLKDIHLSDTCKCGHSAVETANMLKCLPIAQYCALDDFPKIKDIVKRCV